LCTSINSWVAGEQFGDHLNYLADAVFEAFILLIGSRMHDVKGLVQFSVVLVCVGLEGLYICSGMLNYFEAALLLKRKYS
jgi:hypothetical protein